MKYKFNISNLDCANCAARIEDALNKDKNIIKANINFSNLKLTVETNMKSDVLQYVNKIIHKIEPEVEVYEKENYGKSIKTDIIRLISGILIGLMGILIPNIFGQLLVILSYIILLSKTCTKAIKLIVSEKRLNENFLITISCIGAYLIDRQSEGLMVIILYEIGKILEAKAINNSRKSISNLMNIKSDFANLKLNNEIKIVSPEKVKIGDIVIIKNGEKIPLDGVVIKGKSRLNTSALTGESNLMSVSVGDKVLSGMINMEGLLEVKVSADYENSTVSRILELVENATDKKAKTETMVSKLAQIYTPTVFILAILVVLFGVLFTSDAFNVWFYKALVFLVISCPCAIAISVPLSYFAGIGSCSKNGILVKGSNFLDNLKNIKKIIFDKTGTITTGKFENVEIKSLDDNYTEKDIKEIIVQGERLSNHPIAKSIVKLIPIQSDNEDISNFKEYKGKGISFKLNNNKVLIGNYNFCKAENNGSLFYININDKVVGSVKVTDKIKKDAKTTVNSLKNRGIVCEMFTGDNKDSAINVSKNIGIDEVKYELLPQDKYALLERYVNNNETVAFVGDGINDAPVLALATIGISMGGIGSSSAIEASDIVIMNDELNKIDKAIEISVYTSKIIKQNLIFAITTKLLVLFLSILGIASMWQAVFADVGVTLLTILNSTRILKK